MKKLGYIVNKTKDGLIIARSIIRDPRRLVGHTAYDKDLRRIGKIVDVIGRIDAPFVVIKPESKEVVEFVDTGPVYYYVERRPRRFLRRKGGKMKKRRGRGKKRSRRK
ncbi:MAG: RNA-binding protein [Crenarchaeota archaeon]|nr:RNA-binding protein [Thermoproteota archaeon]